ncbi:MULTISPECIES: hypothetical protein [Psychrilyobacter]|uniref:Uncharacterized protein n=1 Tax=Psychrilyobacter piezotolerans TaxID=2293438 RepID=A0ABX9KIX7_9FUSO|nr:MULTISPECIES: hypothetical protein [Psychrilyobacter]MCS5420785.1 hypothetical protein [Psychrilyobacter sp. S5]NDI77421.1 hypothetical protein [Psychrilyobacter piezotolerans]RDE63724.1 hypothetical protein DV867_04940 [Psychrilyobacter sp. S5]REI42068.1 hypothetical protein DYH56_04940 [Psychrilyobacter piezotolerans]
MNKIINFLKDKGLPALAQAVMGNPVGALTTLTGLTGSSTETGILKAFQGDPQLLLKLKEKENEYVRFILDDKKDAREMNFKINDSNNSSWLQKNISALIALVWVSFCIYLYWISLKGEVGSDKQMNSMVVGSITNITMLIIGFYFGSSEIKKR